MQNSMFLAVLRLIFALKREIAPPHRKIAPTKDREMRNRSLDFGRQNALNFGEDLFFWRSLAFGRKNALNLPQSN